MKTLYIITLYTYMPSCLRLHVDRGRRCGAVDLQSDMYMQPDWACAQNITSVWPFVQSSSSSIVAHFLLDSCTDFEIVRWLCVVYGRILTNWRGSEIERGRWKGRENEEKDNELVHSSRSEKMIIIYLKGYGNAWSNRIEDERGLVERFFKDTNTRAELPSSINGLIWSLGRV